jgi:hypothetical protein
MGVKVFSRLGWVGQILVSFFEVGAGGTGSTGICRFRGLESPVVSLYLPGLGVVAI